MNTENKTSTPFMTSPIGDLTLDSDGLRKAIDEIARCHREIALHDKRIKKLETAAFTNNIADSMNASLS